MFHMFRLLRIIVLLLFCVCFAARADTWPARPIHIIAPANAGGASDIYARLLGNKLSVMLGTPVIVENRAGAAGRIGYEHVAKSAPDGYNLIIATSAMLLHRAMYLSLPYDPVKDFAPITLLARNQQLMVIPADFPATDLKSFLAEVKAHPNKYNFASSGVGNPPHLAATLLCAMAGLRMEHIPLTGDAPAIAEVVAGRVAMYLGSVAPGVPMVKAGRVRAIAVSGATRSSALPEVPTMAEGGVAGYNLSGWFGMLAPAGTPPEVVQRLNEAFVKIMAMPDVRQTFIDSGIEPGTSSPRDFGQTIVGMAESFRKTMQIAGIKPEP